MHTIQDLFTQKELQSIMERKQCYKLLKRRNQVIISLMIYQGLTPEEICALKVWDIDVKRLRVSVPATEQTKSRELMLMPRQATLIYDYIKLDRDKLLGMRMSFTLLINKTGANERKENLDRLIKSMQKRFPRRKLSPQTIRMSVLANWLASGIEPQEAEQMAGREIPPQILAALRAAE